MVRDYDHSLLQFFADHAQMSTTTEKMQADSTLSDG